MKKKFQLKGMTCSQCEATVKESLSSVDGVLEATPNKDSAEVEISMKEPLPIGLLQESLPKKYTLSEKTDHGTVTNNLTISEPTKLQQLKPLFLILTYIAVASLLLHREDWNIQHMMYDFMGLFFLVFSFFKLLDIKGFSTTFQMYDPIARNFPLYGKIYPFIETALALMFLFRFNLNIAALATVVILGFTTFGVVNVLLDKKPIKCACLGTALNLPMTEATFIENALMIIMAILLLFQM